MTTARSLRIGFGAPATPVILQNEAAECALACLAMVAASHGLHTDLPTLRQRFNLSLKGATMADLATMARTLKLQTRAVRAEPEQLEQLPLPAILHWDFNHFVVLVKVGRDGVLIHDPAQGARWVKWARLSRHFTGAAMELTPEAGFERRDEHRRITMRQLLGRVTGLKRSLAQIVALALVLEFFVLLSPFFMQWVVDDVLVTADRDLLVTLGIGFALLVAIQVATAAIRSWAVLHLSATLNLQWLGNVFAHLLRLPLAWFERRHMGDIWSRFFAVQQIQKTLTTSFLEVLLDGALVLTTLAMMALYSPLLSGVVLAFVVAYAVLRWALFAPMRRATEEALVHDAKKTSHFLESLRGVMAIKLFAAEADRQARFMNLVVDAMNADIVVRRLEVTLAVANRGLFGLERVLVIWIGASLVLDQRPHGRHAVGLRCLQGAVLAACRRADRQVGRTQDAQGAGRAAGRHRAERAGDGARRHAGAAAESDERAAAHRVARRGIPLLGQRGRCAAWREPEHRAWRVGRHRRPVGLRQDHAHQADAGHPGACAR